MEGSNANLKAQQFVTKNSDLLNQKKYYEFAQKLKLLAHRKFQSKKMDQAAAMFLQGATALYSIQEVEKNIPLQLMDHLIDVFAGDPKQLTKQYQQKIIQVLKKKPIQAQQIDYVRKLIVRSGGPTERSFLTKFFINQNVQNRNFALVQKFAASLSQAQSLEFVSEWASCPGITKQQIPALWSRMCLNRSLYHGINDAQQIMQKIVEKCPKDDPHIVFTGLVLKSGLLNSKNAYQVIERSYAQFLESDSIFQALFNSFGVKFLGIQRSKGGLLSLIQ